MSAQSAVKRRSKREPLPVTDLRTLNLPLSLDRSRFSGVRLDELADSEFLRPPNRLLRVGAIRWLQDSAHDSFSDGRSIWQTLCDVVIRQKLVYRSRSAPLGIPTLMCYKLPDKHWYALDTRRTLVYKIAFHPNQRIPVHATLHTQLVDDKQRSRHWNRQQACSVQLNLRLHKMVPHGLEDFPFVRNIAALNVHPPVRETQRQPHRTQLNVPIESASPLPPEIQVTEPLGNEEEPWHLHWQALQTPVMEQLVEEPKERSEEVGKEMVQNEMTGAQAEELHQQPEVQLDEEDPWGLHWQALQSQAAERLGEETKQDTKEVAKNETKGTHPEELQQLHDVQLDEEDPWDLHWQALQSQVTERLGAETKQDAKEVAKNETKKTQSEELQQLHGAQLSESGGLETQSAWMESCCEKGMPSAKKAVRILMDANPMWSARDLVRELRSHNSGLFSRISFAAGECYHDAQLRRLRNEKRQM